MPYFTLQESPQGLLLNAAIGVSDSRRAALLAHNQPVPPFSQIRGLVDTGASCTCVDPSVVTALGLSPTGIATVNTPSTGATPHTAEQFDVSIVIPGSEPTHSPLMVNNIPVVAAELLAAQGFHALIGRDILSLCFLSYNGIMEQFTLAY